MWFIYLGAGLALLVVSGIYVRRRIGGALAQLGVGEGKVRIVRWLIAWLLFAAPILAIVSVVVGLVLGRATLPRFDGLAVSWLLAVPFAVSALVVAQSVPWLVAVDVAHAIVRRRRGVAAAARLRSIAVLAVVGVFAVYTPVRIVVERDDVRVRHHEVGAAGARTPPFRIAFLADLQQDVHTDADRLREIYATISDARPDLVLAGGDWINMGPDYIEAAAATAATLTSRLGTFSVRGDHEHFAYVDRERSVAEIERAMSAHGITMVNDEVRWFDHAGRRIAVVFLGYNYIARADDATIDTLVASVAHADYSIVVTHQLDARLASRLEGRANLVLAGHTHGGQVNPVLGVMHVPLARLETELVDGRYQLASTTVIVTAGVGYSIVPFRYASPGSVELIDLRLEPATSSLREPRRGGDRPVSSRRAGLSSARNVR